MTFALDVFGDKWSLVILRDIFFKKKRRYGEFLKSTEGISTNILANRLNKLESEGLITKSEDPDNASRYIYGPTEKGTDLLPMMLEMIAWSAKYDPQPDAPDSIIEGAPRRLLRRMRKDRPALVADIIDALWE